MSEEAIKRVGIIVGQEWDWPSAFIEMVHERDPLVQAELIKIGGTFMDSELSYDVIIDRISHEIPYYRAFLTYAAIKGCYVINNPFTWSADNRFVGTVMAQQLGLRTPKTVALPNKDVEKDVGPDSFRNLVYPMDWQGIIDYVGVPAIFKDLRSGGRRQVHRVHNVDELIQRYDESGTQTTILQEVLAAEAHIHAFVVSETAVLLLHYAPDEGRYLPGILSNETERNQTLAESARRLTQAYGYDINMVEFVIKDGDPFVINSTNPAPVIDRHLLTPEQFDWLVSATVNLAIERAKRPLSQQVVFDFGFDHPARS